MDNALDDNQFIGTILIDLSNVFDCVPYRLWMAKIKA